MIKRRAKQTFKAFEKRGISVKTINLSAFDQAALENKKYLGVKDTNLLKPTIEYLEQYGYVVHTIDYKSEMNRAIDFRLINPLTGQHLSGSSSGTALNVLYEINDIGVGTDGGGSILAPAINLNLYSAIMQNLPIKSKQKMSTDQIKFTVCAGLISKTSTDLWQIYARLNPQVNKPCPIYYLYTDDQFKDKVNADYVIKIDKGSSRISQIKRCNEVLEKGIIITYEHEIDIHGIGDSIVGSLSDKFQQLGNKELLKVVNMLNADGLTIPTDNMSSGYLIIAREHRNKLLMVANHFNNHENELINRYFNVENDFDVEYEF